MFMERFSPRFLDVVSVIVVFLVFALFYQSARVQEPDSPDIYIVHEELTMSWIVSGAGTTVINGTYVEDTAGYPSGYNSKPVYLWNDDFDGSPHYLWSDPTRGDVYVISSLPGSGSVEYYSDSSDLPGTVWTTSVAVPPAPTLTGGFSIRFGDSETVADSWDIAANHKYSLYGEDGGSGWDAVLGSRLSDISSAGWYVTGSAPGSWSGYKLQILFDGVVWYQEDFSPSGDSPWSGPFQSAVYLPWASDAAWLARLGSAGAKTCTLRLYDTNTSSTVASDTFVFTMFVPELKLTARRVSGKSRTVGAAVSSGGDVPDVFMLYLDLVTPSEWYSADNGAKLVLTQGVTVYNDISMYGSILLGFSRLIDLANLNISLGGPVATVSAMAEGAFTVVGSLNTFTNPTTSDNFVHDEEYEIALVLEDGDDVYPGPTIIRGYLLQGMKEVGDSVYFMDGLVGATAQSSAVCVCDLTGSIYSNRRVFSLSSLTVLGFALDENSTISIIYDSGDPRYQIDLYWKDSGGTTRDSDSIILDVINEVAPGEDPPDIPDGGDSSLVISGLAITNGAGDSFSVGDTTCRVTGSVSGGSLYALYYRIFVNGVQVQSYTDSPASVGAFSNGFSGLTALSEGDIVKCVLMAYDDAGLSTTASVSAGVGGSKTKTIVIGDDAADFSGWTLDAVSVVGDDLKLTSLGTYYEDSGTLILLYDSGYDSTVWDLLSFTANIPAGTSISVQIATATTEAGLASATYLPASGITASGYVLSNAGISSGRWAAIKITLATTDPTITPTLYSLELFYSTAAGTTASKSWTTTANFNDAVSSSNLTAASDQVVLTGVTDNTYYSPGTIILRVEAPAYVNWGSITRTATKPSGTNVQIRTRSFNRIEDADSATWSSYSAESSFSVVSADSLYLDIEVSMTGGDETPVLSDLSLTYIQEIEADVKYVFTASFDLDSALNTLFVTGNENDQPAGCFVEYKYSVDGITDWGNMRCISRNNLEQVLSSASLSGDVLRIAARLVCCSLTDVAVLDEFAFIFSTEDGERHQIL